MNKLLLLLSLVFVIGSTKADDFRASDQPVPGTASKVVFDLPRVSVWYDTAKKAFVHREMDDKGGVKEMTTLDKISPRKGKLSVRLLVDRLSLEAYAFGGESFSAHYINPKQGPKLVSIHALGGAAVIHDLRLRELKSAWTKLL